MLPIKVKIETACKIAGLTITELAEKLGTSQSAFSQRLKRGKFTDKDFLLIAQALGCDYKSGFYFPDGQKID